MKYKRNASQTWFDQKSQGTTLPLFCSVPSHTTQHRSFHDSSASLLSASHALKDKKIKISIQPKCIFR
jgi:hypothetical protein